MHEKDLIRAEESARKYVKAFADPERVGVNVRSKRGPSEPFMLYPSKKSLMRYKDIAFHISYAMLNRLEDGDGDIYGRTDWGPFCLLRVYKYKIIQVRVLPSADQKKIERLIRGDEDV